jgi:hypothetical protein
MVQAVEGFGVPGVYKIGRCRLAGINYAPPLTRRAFLNRKNQILPESIDHHIKIGIILGVSMQTIPQCV